MKKIFLLIIVLLSAGGYVLFSDDGGNDVAIDDLPVIRADDTVLKEIPSDDGGLEVAGQDNTLFSVLDEGENTNSDAVPLQEQDAEGAVITESTGFIIPAIPETQIENLGELTDGDAAPEQSEAEVEAAPELTAAPEAVEETVTQDKLEEQQLATIAENTMPSPEITHDYTAQPVIEAESQMAPPSMTVANISVTPTSKPELPVQELLRQKMVTAPLAKPRFQPMRTANAQPAVAVDGGDLFEVEAMREMQAKAVPSTDPLDQPLQPAPKKSFFERLGERTAGKMKPIIDDVPVLDQTQQQGQSTVVVEQRMVLPDDDVNAPVVDASSGATAPSQKPKTAAPAVYYAQLASLPSREGAEATWAKLQNRFPSILNEMPVRFFVANVPGRGTYTRVQVGGLSETQAREICARLSAAGKNDGCLVLRGG